MHKKLIFSTITLVACFAILLGASLTLPKQSHAAAASQKKSTSSTTNATISVSPGSLPTSQCTLLTHNAAPSPNSEACPVTVTLNKSVSKGLHWTVSYTATACYTTCNSDTSDFAIALFGGGSTLYKSGDTALVYIIGPDSEFHIGINATFTFSGPNNTVKIQYQPPQYD